MTPVNRDPAQCGSANEIILSQAYGEGSNSGMSTIRPLIPRLSTLLRKKPFPTPSPGPPLWPGILVDEEISPVYDSKYFYPAKPGEVLDDRYQILVKVGWGVSSTVWLARDLEGHTEEPEHVVTLKIVNNNAGSAGREREVEEHISTSDPSHRGRSLIRTIVHTDLKLENIMVSFEDPTVLADFMDSQLENPMAFKIDSTGRPVYQSRNDFGPLKSLRSIPQLVDFGLATRLEEDDDWGVWPIQPDHYRAPEVVLGIGWQMPADIWNFGVLLWDMIGGRELFRHIHDQQGRYDAKLHIAEMVALLGPPPPEIIQRYEYMREYSWPEPVRREDGRVCETAEEYFGGPFFDDNGRFIYQDLIPNRKLDDTFSFLEGEEREAFLDLAKGMLVWHPNARKTAGELARHAFLQPKPSA
ncbi:hypothetical protein DTO027B5_414 [Paecilomyces variotii]|nr:hypothetical protein DTO169C6_8631 [Paecilomyces variotii]KAJ9326655.1 hypothetical protein DTO027B3_2316 [Paecilomyces variotii]KAJ9337593.1 hypothetical protein DTO027B5_414 [Paecilomyces variotii]